MDGLFLTDVPVPNPVKINKTHVVTTNLRNHLLALHNRAREVVLGLAADIAEFKAGSDFILGVLKGHFADQLMAHCTHQDVVKKVIKVRVTNPLAVLEE